MDGNVPASNLRGVLISHSANHKHLHKSSPKKFLQNRMKSQ